MTISVLRQSALRGSYEGFCSWRDGAPSGIPMIRRSMNSEIQVAGISLQAYYLLSRCRRISVF